eukprot:6383445-Pyramimonas_sp.AAC.1
MRAGTACPCIREVSIPTISYGRHERAPATECHINFLDLIDCRFAGDLSSGSHEIQAFVHAFYSETPNKFFILHDWVLGDT